MSWNSVMGFISSIAFFLPILLIIVLRLGGYRSFPALLIYYIVVLMYNLFTEGYINANHNFTYYWGIGDNLLDAPLMLFFLTYFSTTARFTKRVRAIILLFMVFEVTVILLGGFNIASLTIIIGPGLLIVFAFCLHFFIRQTKITIVHGKGTGKALMISSLLFVYGCYGIIYLMYYVFKTPNKSDSFLVYFLASTFSSLLMCAGIVIERKRVQKLEELKITRKELSIVYRQIQPAIPSKTALPKKERFN